MATELAPDWILQQALDAQRKANTAWVNGKPELDDGGLTLSVIGCGTMGIAIIGGILQHNLRASAATTTTTTSLTSPSEPSTPPEPAPTRLPTKFNASVRRPESAKRIKKELAKYPARLTVYENDNLTPTREGDIILLCCKPQLVRDILQAEGIKEALAGKLLISICAGLSEEKIYEILYGNESSPVGKCTVIRAMPNTAAAVQESMTVISIPTEPLSPEIRSLVTWIFTRIGRVTQLPAANMDACTALCGSGPAFVALVVESLAAGGIAMGLPRDEAYTMAAQTMRGTTGLLLQGQHPAILRDQVSTPGGCTIGGLQVLEEGMVRGTVAKAVREATLVAGQLGQVKPTVDGDGV